MLNQLSKIVTTILFILLLSYCGQKKYSIEDIKEIIKNTDENLHGLEAKQYEWASKKAYSNIMAYYPLSGYIFLNEIIRFRSGGDSFNHYYFKNGNLVFYKERKLTFKIPLNTIKEAINTAS